NCSGFCIVGDIAPHLRPSPLQAHLVLESNSLFGLFLYWTTLALDFGCILKRGSGLHEIGFVPQNQFLRRMEARPDTSGGRPGEV
ncbi:MAG: hypothetical protein ACLQBJ_13975, partial [Bryobacteraceae bacterium]